jgi:hypothetical protein
MLQLRLTVNGYARKVRKQAEAVPLPGQMIVRTEEKLLQNIVGSIK